MNSQDSLSHQLFERASRSIPGGVNSPVRAFRAVGGVPPFIRSGKGSRLVDVDDREYIDYVGSWGPMILGHAHPEVVEALREAAGKGTSFGAPTELEVRLAERIQEFFPSIEQVRLVNSGTEATMSAIRLARGYTGRSLIIKFDGCYHGHSDGLLARAGSGVATLGLPDTPGVPSEFTSQTITLPFNDLSAVREAFDRYPGKIAALILEPVTGNMGVIVPEKSYIQGILDLSEKEGSLVIFDEVMTGFRVTPGGAQEYFGVRPPLTCLGKILGGGLPIGAYGGRKEIMQKVAPAGPVYQAGTLSGNPVAVSAGLKTLEILQRDNPYPRLAEYTGKMCRSLQKEAEARGIDLQVHSCGSMFTAFFTPERVNDFTTAKLSNTELFARFFGGMLKRGIYLAPSQFEAGFVSAAHTQSDLEATCSAAAETLEELQSI